MVCNLRVGKSLYLLQVQTQNSLLLWLLVCISVISLLVCLRVQICKKFIIIIYLFLYPSIWISLHIECWHVLGYIHAVLVYISYVITCNLLKCLYKRLFCCSMPWLRIWLMMKLTRNLISHFQCRPIYLAVIFSQHLHFQLDSQHPQPLICSSHGISCQYQLYNEILLFGKKMELYL